MTSALPDFAATGPGDKRLLGFLLLSLLLHFLWLALPLAKPASPASIRPLPTLAVHLAQPQSPREVAVEPASPKPVQGARGDAARAVAAARSETEKTIHAERQPASPQAGQHSPINLETAFAAARSIAKSTNPAPDATGGPALPPTVESAVAKATKTDVVVESRGADGEWITRDRKSRCVARTQRKWFEEGVPMLPLCEVRKG